MKFRCLTALALLLLPRIALAAPGAPEMPRFHWENYTTANGLPDNHVFCVLVDGPRVWAGTETGWRCSRAANGRCSRPRTDWRIARCCRWRSIAARAMCGRERWAD